MKVYVDGSTTRVCYIIGDREPVVVPLSRKVTVNEGEYLAVLCALKELPRETATPIEVFSDSRLVICQLTGVYKIRKPHLLELAREIQQYWGWRQIKYTWISRWKNPAGLVLDRL